MNIHNINQGRFNFYGYLSLFLITSGLPLWAVTAGAGGDAFAVTEIALGNYLHEGTHVALDRPGADDIANIGFIIGNECVAVIDSGGSVRTGSALRETIRNVTDKPVCYVINTHIHFDHVLGNVVFAGDNTEFLGHKNLPEAMEANRGFFLQEFARYLGDSPTEKSIVAPGKTVAGTYSIDLGERELTLTAYQPSHTHTDLTVFDQKTGTLWAGDLVFRERVPVIDGSLKGWLEVMQELKKQDISLIIPGHGPPGNNWNEALSAQEEYLNLLLNETRRAIADGMFMEEAIDTIGKGEKGKWLLFDQHHRANVSRAFLELEWE